MESARDTIFQIKEKLVISAAGVGVGGVIGRIVGGIQTDEKIDVMQNNLDCVNNVYVPAYDNNTNVSFVAVSAKAVGESASNSTNVTCDAKGIIEKINISGVG